MKRLAACLLVLSGLGLAGCNSSKELSYDAPKPLDKMSKEEWCAFYAHYLTTPNLPEQTKKSDIQKMRDKGCPAV